MKADLDITGYQPDLVAGKDGQQVIVRCEIVDQPATGPQRSGKYIHLGLTAADAMRLLFLVYRRPRSVWLGGSSDEGDSVSAGGRPKLAPSCLILLTRRRLDHSVNGALELFPRTGFVIGWARAGALRIVAHRRNLSHGEGDVAKNWYKTPIDETEEGKARLDAYYSALGKFVDRFSKV